jgi:hypothetical protein
LDFAYELAARAGGSIVAVGVALPLAPFAIDDVRNPTPYLDDEMIVPRAARSARP